MGWEATDHCFCLWSGRVFHLLPTSGWVQSSERVALEAPTGPGMWPGSPVVACRRKQPSWGNTMGSCSADKAAGKFLLFPFPSTDHPSPPPQQLGRLNKVHFLRAVQGPVNDNPFYLIKSSMSPGRILQPSQCVFEAEETECQGPPEAGGKVRWPGHTSQAQTGILRLNPQVSLLWLHLVHSLLSFFLLSQGGRRLSLIN